MICKECGEEIKEEARFCPFCGTVQNGVAPEGSQAALSGNDMMTDEAKKDNRKYKNPVFKTSKNKPEDPKKAKARSFKQKMIDVVLVVLIIAIAGGMLSFRFMTVRNQKKLFSMVAYVKDGVLYLDTDIKSESDDPIPVSKINYALLEYGFGNQIASFSADNKILYFMDKDTGDGSGRLKKVKIDKLTQDMDANSDNAEKVADFVTAYKVLDNNSVLYETNDMEVCYYDGKNNKVIAEDVAYAYLSYSENYVYLLEGDEQGTTFDLGRKGLNSKADVEILAEDVSYVITAKDSDALMFVVEKDSEDDKDSSKTESVSLDNETESSDDENEALDEQTSQTSEKYNELYLTFDNKEPVKIGENIDDWSSYCASEGGVFFTSKKSDETYTLNYYDTKSETCTEVEGISDVHLGTGICVYTKDDPDDWFYMLAGGQEQSLDYEYEYEDGEVWCSLDGRYVLMEFVSDENDGNIVVSFRATDGTLSSDKLVTSNGRIGISEDTTAYYISYNEEEDEADMYSFHNDRTKLLAKDINEDYISIVISADKLWVMYNSYNYELFLYKDANEMMDDSNVQELVYAGKNSVIYKGDTNYYLAYLEKKETETITIVEDADCIIVPEETLTSGTFIGN